MSPPVPAALTASAAWAPGAPRSGRRGQPPGGVRRRCRCAGQQGVPPATVPAAGPPLSCCCCCLTPLPTAPCCLALCQMTLQSCQGCPAQPWRAGSGGQAVARARCWQPSHGCRCLRTRRGCRRGALACRKLMSRCRCRCRGWRCCLCLWRAVQPQRCRRPRPLSAWPGQPCCWSGVGRDWPAQHQLQATAGGRLPGAQLRTQPRTRCCCWSTRGRAGLRQRRSAAPCCCQACCYAYPGLQLRCHCQIRQRTTRGWLAVVKAQQEDPSRRSRR